ncbi:MAG: hypothetical protein CMJ94_07450 [Planctomycetes bacterium]|nr:hypothetical protein [Planctomycetota bacterium]
MARALHVRRAARHEDLDERYWEVRADPADDNALAILVTDAERLPAEAVEVIAFPDGMPRDVDWEALPVRPRTRRAVRISGIRDGQVDAAGLTIGELLRLRGVNMMSALELACVVEAMHDGAGPGKPAREPAEVVAAPGNAPAPPPRQQLATSAAAG